MAQPDQIGTLPERPPEVGELVQVRSRRWLVEEVTPSEIPGASILVTLACADDDAQGQALRVFWDYEIDRRILEEEGWAHLAERGFDDARRFAVFLRTLRWHCVTATGASLFQAPFRAGIRIDAYQMEPLRKALRRRRRCWSSGRGSWRIASARSSRSSTVPTWRGCAASEASA